MEGIGKLPLWQRVLMFHLVPADSKLLAGFLSESLLLADDEKILTAFELVLTQQRLMPIPVPSSGWRCRQTWKSGSSSSKPCPFCTWTMMFGKCCSVDWMTQIGAVAGHGGQSLRSVTSGDVCAASVRDVPVFH